jgi:hypothetical protein
VKRVRYIAARGIRRRYREWDSLADIVESVCNGDFQNPTSQATADRCKERLTAGIPLSINGFLSSDMVVAR